ncbi:MAG: undecaprenyldiphospho-muramoylpentapeptide beta-N-acetylglucosaminyltransferase [Lachnospiraceae bacterium]|nr:undecaprenyldiphospho-muramoylpentapeptide beta-N-acetylglucosaminyltransferase [Lachnospiraceae bacterium]
MKKILLTGGGTAGHVTPNIALMDRLKEEGYEIYYMGSHDGIERELIENLGITYYPISSGKLRRYHSWKNFTDPFRVNKGCFEARKIIKKLKPDVCFSKGGFVSVPVVYAAKRCKVPTIIHESDMTPGLANKISIRRATKVCCNFPETIKYLPKNKGVHTGTPIRKELFTGSKEEALAFCGFTDAALKDKPVLLVVGGSTGAVAVNEAVRKSLDTLLKKYNVIHLCGKGKADESFNNRAGYKQIEYCDKEMKDMLAAADVVLSRAGANAIFELLALRKPNILIPLPAKASRGDQILNAESFEKQGFSKVLPEETITPDLLVKTIDEVYSEQDKYKEAMNKSKTSDAVEIIMALIKEVQK